MHSRILQHIAFVALLALAIPAVAQSKKAEPETFTGKVTDIQMKPGSKVATIKVETDSGETFTVITTPKVNFTVTAKAEADLLKKLGKEPVMISAERTVWNEATKVYVASALTVYHKVKVKEGRTEMNGGVDFCAPLISSTDKEVILGRPINNKVIPEGATFVLNVVSNDASLVTAGAQAELEGIKKGEKFLASRLAITLDKELTAEEVSMKKGSKKTTAKPVDKTDDKSADKPSEKGTDKPADKGDGKPLAASDPFKDVKSVQDDKVKKGGLTATDPFKGGVKGDKSPKGPLPTTDPFKDAGKGDKPKN